MIVSMCISCSWFNRKSEVCAIHKRKTSPTDTCECFFELSENYLDSSYIPNAKIEKKKLSLSQLRKTPFCIVQKAYSL